MASFFFGVNGPTLDFRQDLLISDSDAPRILMYLASTECGFVQETNADGGIITRVATAEETAANYARKTLSDLLTATTAYEKAQAAAAAAASVTPIEPIG